MNDANFIEDFIEHLTIKYCHWLFEGNESNADVVKFIDWCVKDANNDLHAPRGRDGKSFFQRREDDNSKGQKALDDKNNS